MIETIEKEDLVDKYNKARLMLEVVYKKLNPLQDEVNQENLIQRNSLCRCGSKKRWKICCMKDHEQKTLMLEELVKKYNKLNDWAYKMKKELKL